MSETPQPILARGPRQAIVAQFERRAEAAPDPVSMISTAELARRPSRPPDHVAENRALVALAQEMAASPEGILQKLADTALALCRAHSAGLSLLEEGDHKSNFHWRAIAGQWAPHLGGGTPRDFGPCGTVLDRNEALLCVHPERDFPYWGAVMPVLDEGLLIPFYVDGEALGTIWVVAHDASRRFDAEDLRVMTNLGTFAAAAYQTLLSIHATEKANQELRQSATAKELLLNEMKHRINNNLATVQALATQTLHSVTKDERASFVARLHTLARAHELLTHDWDRAPVKEIVRRALDPFQERHQTHLLIEGPDAVFLDPNKALLLTMTLHELATNAVKYGALSNGSGQVRVAWELLDNNGLKLRWQESGGPAVKPPERRGFGSLLIERALHGEAGAHLDFAAEGVRCTLIIPL